MASVAFSGQVLAHSLGDIDWSFTGSEQGLVTFCLLLDANNHLTIDS